MSRLRLETRLLGVLTMFGIVVVLLAALMVPPIAIVKPNVRFVMGGFRGSTVDYQVRIPLHSENRWVTLAWDGESCGGSWGKSIDGDNEWTLFPDEPLKVRMGSGTCFFVATLIDSRGKVRGQATWEVEGR